jgi:hypothetical protein
MGNATSTASTWSSYSAANTGATFKQTFKSRMLHGDLDPALIKGPRESCDSAANPASSPMSIWLDQTGSMGNIPQYMMSPDGMPVIFREIYDKKPVTDPHIMFGAIGDANTGEEAPLQVTQFEADISLVDQLKNVYLVGGGGGNGSESYPLAWHFCANHTALDSFTKRQRKGFLWTIGDDAPPHSLTPLNLARVYVPGFYQMSAAAQEDAMGQFSELTLQQLYDMVSRQWHVFHIHVRHGAYDDSRVEKAWKKILGERALMLDDYTALSEVIVSTMQLVAGVDRATVVGGWTGSKAVVVANTIRGLTPAIVDPQALVAASKSSAQVIAF